ncbi:MAG: arginine--tRNA ligase [Planctomycetes bacterium GWF2_50_10]|nr:MAG: arginine--tRNA ligase [Planctomycetes bacterium GWF2_50_10]
MIRIIEILSVRVRDAIKAATGLDADPLLRISADSRFGDYQANGIMAIAKQAKSNPRALAGQVVEKLDVADLCETPEIAGPGFINFRLKPDFLAIRLMEVKSDSVRLGISPTQNHTKVVVDFSGPNIAKQMHVGHLRSTIIGDAICRLLEFEGYDVIPQNHIGDWGLQIGMVVHAMMASTLETKTWAGASGALLSIEEVHNRIEKSPITLIELEKMYKRLSEQEKTDENLAEAVRNSVRHLQLKEPVFLAFWENARKITLKTCFELYDYLGGIFKLDDIRGESFYADRLAPVVQELKDKGIAVESDGAVCVFAPGFVSKEGNPLPLIVQKSDGAFLYATTDLAALKFRVQELGAKKIIYVTDARQELHFKMVFAVARMAGWVPEDVSLEHVTFGSVLGEDGKPFKTRSGENVKLRDLLDEAVSRAKRVVEEKNPELPEEKKNDIAAAVGIGAVKYADYSNNRTSDYVFSFDRMLAMEGNTAPYMQYAYARVKSIERKALEKGINASEELALITNITLTEPTEIELAKTLCRYDEAIYSAAYDLRPNYLTAYLYDLAGKFSAFYTQCPVLTAGPESRPSRLLLCDLTAKNIAHGLSNLLGIKVVEQM